MTLATRWLQRLTLARLWPLIALGFVFAFAASHPVRPHDFWWHLRAGNDLLASRAIPTTDTFSYTRGGAPYGNFAAFWLVEIAYAALYRLGGLSLLVTIQALLLTLTYGLILRLAWESSGSLRIASICALFAVALGLDNWNLRPQSVAYLFFALCLWAILSYRRRPRRWLLVVPPIVVAVWANSHGSFFLGVLLVAIWLADALWSAGWRAFAQGRSNGRGQLDLRAARPAAYALAATLLASLANPRGAGIYGYVGAISGSEAVRRLATEWQPPGFDTLAGGLFIAAVLLVAVLLAVSPRRPDAFTLLIFVAFATLGFSSGRSVVWFGLAVAPLLAAHLAALGQRLPGFDKSPRAAQRPAAIALNAALAGLVLLAAFFSLPWFKGALPLRAEKAGLVSVETPVDAVRVLEAQRLPGRLFHDEAAGSYLTWAAPEYPVYVDTRIELYPLDLWNEYFQISAAAPGWEARLAARGVNTLLLARESQSQLIDAARASAEWRVVWEDARFAVLTRREAR